YLFNRLPMFFDIIHRTRYWMPGKLICWHKVTENFLPTISCHIFSRTVSAIESAGSGHQYSPDIDLPHYLTGVLLRILISFFASAVQS
ncbi:TPA: hypothetical protein ACURMI_001823, partial [Escherichia coli]